MLDRIDVGGGTDTERRTFYSALYQSLLHPNVFSDDNGEYPGFDHRVHTASPGPQYANFSSWDIYRSEMPLLTLIAAPQTSAMMRSLLADTEQSGSLPKLAVRRRRDRRDQNGDSSVPILAEAYAFGARNFDTAAALQTMVNGATDKGTGLGWDVERQDLDEYLRQGWIQVDRRDKTSFDYTIGGSETLEYAIDDSAIAQFAAAIGDRATAATYTTRAENWRHLVNPATHWLAARARRGRFPPGPAFQVSPLAGHRPGRLGRGQLDPVLVERAAGPPRAHRRDGRRRRWRSPRSTRSSRISTPAVSSRTTGPATNPRSASRGTTTTRARRRARRTSCAASPPSSTRPHRTATRQRRPRRDVVVVRVGRDRHVPRDARVAPISR